MQIVSQSPSFHQTEWMSSAAGLLPLAPHPSLLPSRYSLSPGGMQMMRHTSNLAWNESEGVPPHALFVLQWVKVLLLPHHGLHCWKWRNTTWHHSSSNVGIPCEVSQYGNGLSNSGRIGLHQAKLQDNLALRNNPALFGAFSIKLWNNVVGGTFWEIGASTPAPSLALLCCANLFRHFFFIRLKKLRKPLCLFPDVLASWGNGMFSSIFLSSWGQ